MNCKQWSHEECTEGSSNNVCLTLPVWWKWNTLRRIKKYIACGRLVLYWVTLLLTPFFNLSKCVEFCSNFFFFSIYYQNNTVLLCTARIWNVCFIKHYSNRCLFFTLKALIFSFSFTFYLYFTIFQITLSARQIGILAEVKEKAFPSISLQILSNLCRSGCSPRVLLHPRAVTFNLTSTEKKIEIL